MLDFCYIRDVDHRSPHLQAIAGTLSTWGCDDSLVCDHEGIEAPQTQVFAPGNRFGRECQVWHTLQYLFHYRTTLDARQWCAETEMAGPREGDMSVVLPAEIKPIGIGKARRITVRRAHYGNDCLSLAN